MKKTNIDWPKEFENYSKSELAQLSIAKKKDQKNDVPLSLSAYKRFTKYLVCGLICFEIIRLDSGFLNSLLDSFSPTFYRFIILSSDFVFQTFSLESVLHTLFAILELFQGRLNIYPWIEFYLTLYTI
ncbi:hypothetical protein [Leptospira alexanderi]|uniref:hypothetical protein n=1 Tax=Leptospira alexanderi TaxID=100053 RepID=UPI00111551ED|nr:hypothetical protein [Leptospira alexanderi]